MSYLSDGILVYLNELADWDAYFEHYKGGDVDTQAERQALLGVLETCAEICAEIEPEARAGWNEAARLVDGQVVVPVHIRRGYERLRDAGLTALSFREEYECF